MTSVTPELLVLMFGCLAALSGLQSVSEISQKRWPFQGLFFLGLITQIATQGIQYSNAIGDRTARERNEAFALFAYTARDVELLRHYSKGNPYIVGYRLFKDDKTDRAVPYFEHSIELGKFVAPSHYLLAHIILTKQKDRTKAREHLDAAIKHDKEYAAAYYARAKMKYSAKEFAAAIEDLGKAARYGLLSCMDLNRSEEIKNLWEDLADDERLKEIQTKCRDRHGFSLKEAEPSFLPSPL